MTKWKKLVPAAVACLVLSLCGALFAACSQNKTETVTVDGEIVFESRSEYDYDTDITLSFTPNEGELNAPASLSYRDSVGRSVTADGFTLVQSGESYSLLDENGQSYALDLVWNSKDPKDAHVTVYGDFVADKRFAEYEEHKEGERFLLEEGHYGAGKLDASGKQWRFRCEPIRLSDGSELCIYAEADDGTDAFVHKQYGPLQFFTQETKDGDYLLYCYLIPANGNSEEKLLVRDVVRFAPDCKKTQPRTFETIEMFLKYGEVVYAADGFGIEEGDEVFSVYEYQDWEWSDGSLHDFACPAGNLIHVEDADGDFLIYEYWKYDNDLVCVYFKCDGDNVDWESAAPGWHGLRYSKDGKWGTEMFYHMSGDDPVFDAMFAFGPMESGEVQFFQGADIVKNASGDFTVTTDEGAWHVTLQYGGPEVKLIFTVEKIVTLKGEVVFTHESGNPYDTAIELSYFSGDSERSEDPATLSFENAEGETVTKEGFTLSLEKKILADAEGKSYHIECTEQNGKTFVTVHGEYVVTRTVGDYEAHEEGKRHYFEEGYFGLGALDLSGPVCYYHFEDMESSESDYLRFDVDSAIPYEMDGEEHFYLNYTMNDGGIYIIYYDLLQVSGEDKMRVTDIEFYPADAECVDFSLYFIDMRIRYGECKYAEDGAQTGKGTFYVFEDGGWTWPDGTEHDRLTICYKREFLSESELLYYFDIGDGDVGILAFTLQNGRPDPETVRYGWRTVLHTADSRYGVDAFCYNPAEGEYALGHLFAFGDFTEDGAIAPFTVTKTETLDESTVVAVTADGSRWVIGLSLQIKEGGEYLRILVEKSDKNAAVDYANFFNWAYQETDVEGKEADVFFVAPSAVNGGAGQEILDFTRSSARKNFIGAIDMEKGIYDDNARFFAPFYRQAVLYTYSSEVSSAEREGYLTYAYADVKNAFEYYLRNWNEGRPIILAGFSQGADHCLRLMKEFYGSTLKDRLVACYAIGWSITQEELDGADLKFAAGETDTGIIVSFNCEAPSVKDSLIIPTGKKSLCINPLNWETGGAAAEKSLNKGACFYKVDGSFIEEKEGLTGAYIDETRGALKVPDIDPKEYDNTLGIFEEGIYHYYDYQFFYRNLEENVQKRIGAFLQNAS